MNKAVIAPIVALFAMVAKQSYGIELAQVEIDIIVDSILSVVTLYGIMFVNPKKEQDPQ